ncbi:carboxypeptidase B-like [Bicyclus anynana]|uniref:Carboxypeptidase B-like n=1 Tax=Bicyclus anynana TaxID=110368 RepID=A0ABM3LZM2_BICAN|nr:carboxypeptidase B-like [Bicyclus anynana]
MKVLLVFLFTLVCAKHELYEGWKSFFVKPSNVEQLNALRNMVHKFELDFISHPTVHTAAVVVVKPPHQHGFLTILAEEDIEHWIHVEDVKAQLAFDDQLIEAQHTTKRSIGTEGITYENYQPLEIIYEYLETTAQKYNETVTIVTPANSFEGRPIKYLKVSKDNFRSNKPVIFIDACIHAREWITIPAVTYAIHKLVENVTEPDLLENFDWILLPVVNADGYKYSYDVERLWRKTRSTDQHVLGTICPGVDGNRNYNFSWNSAGSGKNPCSDQFAGSKPFSEIETRVVDGILKEHIHKIALYISMHSFGSMILYPWGHDGTISKEESILHDAGIKMADEIFQSSTLQFPKYKVGNSAILLDYTASGASDDYTHSLGVPLTYTFELPGFDLDGSGFILNPKYIKQVSVDTWAGVVTGAREAGKIFTIT